MDLDSGYLFGLSLSATRDGEAWAELLREGQAQGLGLSVVVKDAARGIAAGVSEVFPRAELRIPTKPITDSGVKPITRSGQADHLSERNDAGVHHAVLNGFAARFTMASDMLHELAAQDSDTSLARRLRRFTGPQLLAIDDGWTPSRPTGASSGLR